MCFLSDFFGFEPNNHGDVYETVGQPEFKDEWSEIPEVPGHFQEELKLPEN